MFARLTFLKAVRTLSTSTECYFSVESDLDNVTHSVSCYDSDISIDCAPWDSEIHGILLQLHHDGYIIFNSRTDSFKLTYKGAHPFVITLQEFLEFLFKSILTPIIVTILTTLLTKGW